MPHRFVFATESDLARGLDTLEREYRLKYSLAGGFYPGPCAPTYLSWREIPDFSHEKSAWMITGRTFLVYPTNVDLNFERIEQFDGVIRYSLKSDRNPRAMELHPGGFYSDRVLMGGFVSAWPPDTNCAAVYRQFVPTITREFKAIRDSGSRQLWWVGPEAMSLLDSGVKLALGGSDLAGLNLSGVSDHSAVADDTEIT